MSLTAEERDAVGAIARAITASESGFDAAVFNVLVEQIRRVATFDVVAISIEDADRMGLRIFWQNRAGEVAPFLTGAHVPIDPADIRQDISPDMMPLVVEDIVSATALERALVASNVKSYVAVPMWLGRGVAWLTTAHESRGAPSQGSLAVLLEMARVLVPALVRARAAGRDRLLAALVDASEDGLVALDRSFVVREISQAALDLLGTTRASALERGLAALTGEGAAQAIRRAVDSGTRDIVELEIDRPSGPVVLDLVASEVGLAPDATVLVHLRDARPRIESRARRMHADRLATIGALAGGVAHEINNPVAFITLAMSQIERAVVDGNAAKLAAAATLCREVQEAAGRIGHIVGELKLFTRIPEGALATPVDVNRLVRTAVTLASAEIRRFGAVDVRYGDIPSAPGAFATLGPVFVSILLAAAQALERATSLGRSLRVDVETLERDGAIVVAIADNGAGIPTGSLPRLFDPFSEGSGDGPTAGLGLALAHDLVRRAGGSIKVESEPGTGTRFEVVLPLADAPAPVVETA